MYLSYLVLDLQNVYVNFSKGIDKRVRIFWIFRVEVVQAREASLSKMINTTTKDKKWQACTFNTLNYAKQNKRKFDCKS